MGFTKLDEGIIRSSIWAAPYPTRLLWVTMLALKDEDGYVESSHSGLMRSANITQEEFDNAIACLESPDLDSRTPDYEGRRVQKIDGGWIVLNHEKYRIAEHEKTLKRKEYMKQYMRKYRDVNPNSSLQDTNNGFTSVSVSGSVSSQEGESERKPFAPPPHLAQLWPDYLVTRRQKRAAKTDSALQRIVDKLAALAPNDHKRQCAILEQSINSGWIDVFPLRSNNNNPGRQQADPPKPAYLREFPR